ncbi:type II toxin-antitoxin system VapC family toxin [Thermus sp.]|uniref:type II toxin-antitoxin system VapC family toxin n=1 Tax=Thermus sp. TaxID=275 RepID=UPI00307CDA7A
MSKVCWVVDASLALPHLAQKEAEAFWREEAPKGEVWVPRLFVAEVASVLRTLVFVRRMVQREAEEILEALLGLPDHFAEDEALAFRALRWAEVLGQKRAYEAFYVALAEDKGAQLLPADLELVHALRAQGVPWIQPLGEVP